MSIKKQSDSRYLVDIRPRGTSGKRVRKKFETKREAVYFEKWVLSNLHDKAWESKPNDTRELTELIDLWFEYYGRTLRDSQAIKRKLLNIDKFMNHPLATEIDHAWWGRYRTKRLSDGKTPATINKDLMILSGVFSKLIESGQFIHDNPLSKISKIKLPQREMAFLSLEEITKLLTYLEDDREAWCVANICLSTGCRIGEAEELKGSQVLSDKIILDKTKSGKTRIIAISHELRAVLPNKSSNERLFSPCYDRIYKAIKALFSLPKGQATHVLRHTFASQFIISGGHILALQKILGHSTINQTMVYAHLSTEHMEDVLNHNPISKIRMST